jgi:hypothetical protein
MKSMMKKLSSAARGAVAVAPKKAVPMMAGAVAAATKKMTPALGGAATAAAKPAVGAALQKKSIGKVIGRGLMGRR